MELYAKSINLDLSFVLLKQTLQIHIFITPLKICLNLKFCHTNVLLFK